MSDVTIGITYRVDEKLMRITFDPNTGDVRSMVDGQPGLPVRLSRMRSRILAALLFGVLSGLTKVLSGETDQNSDPEQENGEWPELLEMIKCR